MASGAQRAVHKRPQLQLRKKAQHLRTRSCAHDNTDSQGAQRCTRMWTKPQCTSFCLPSIRDLARLGHYNCAQYKVILKGMPCSSTVLVMTMRACRDEAPRARAPECAARRHCPAARWRPADQPVLLRAPHSLQRRAAR